MKSRIAILVSLALIVFGICNYFLFHSSNEGVEISPTDPSLGDSFGKVLSISGSRLAVAKSETDLPYGSVGKEIPPSISVFDIESGRLVQTIRNENKTFKENVRDDGTTYKSYPTFAESVEIAGDRVVVGVTWSGGDRGEVQVFDLDTHKLISVLTPEKNGSSDSTAPTLYGLTVGVAGNRVITSSPKLMFAEVFDISGGTASRLFRLQAGDSWDFGRIVSISDKYAAVTGGDEVFVFDVDSGSLLRRLIVDDENMGDGQGNIPSLAISEDQLLYGVSGHQGQAEDREWGEEYDYDFGAVYLFDLETGGLVFRLFGSKKTPGDLFGHSVAFSDKYIAIGAPGDGGGRGGGNRGEVYIFDRSSGEELLYMTGPESDIWDEYGKSVAISEEHLAIGAPSYYSSSRSGKAYIYNLSELGL